MLILKTFFFQGFFHAHIVITNEIADYGTFHIVKDFLKRHFKSEKLI